MEPRFANVDGVRIAFSTEGQGQPLVLVMGYRLSSSAWPRAVIEQLARDYMVITLDNRGTGHSDKPVKGYAIANMARDVRAVLDELGLAQVHLLGYSMGGAIAQEFVRQFPDRVSKLILCATMPGGSRAKYASASVVSVMRDLDGLTPEQAARRIWQVTYAPSYLERHRDLAEVQMRREIAVPTPLHAADLQFQAFAEFDGSKALADIRCPTLVLTGDLDRLIPPENSLLMARIIPDAKLVLLEGYGHRVLWEDSDLCVELIAGFLASDSDAMAMSVRRDLPRQQAYAASLPDALTSPIDWLAAWPFAVMQAGLASLAAAQQSLLVGSASRFGDGKPVILVPQLYAAQLMLFPTSVWLKALGYRPVTASPSLGRAAAGGDGSLSDMIHEVTRRVGRKAILVTHALSMSEVLRAAEAHPAHISDVVVIGTARDPGIRGVRTHVIPAWPGLHSMLGLPRLLRDIDLELIDVAD